MTERLRVVGGPLDGRTVVSRLRVPVPDGLGPVEPEGTA